MDQQLLKDLGVATLAVTAVVALLIGTGGSILAIAALVFMALTLLRFVTNILENYFVKGVAVALESGTLLLIGLGIAGYGVLVPCRGAWCGIVTIALPAILGVFLATLVPVAAWAERIAKHRKVIFWTAGAIILWRLTMHFVQVFTYY